MTTRLFPHLLGPRCLYKELCNKTHPHKPLCKIFFYWTTFTVSPDGQKRREKRTFCGKTSLCLSYFFWLFRWSLWRQSETTEGLESHFPLKVTVVDRQRLWKTSVLMNFFFLLLPATVFTVHHSAHYPQCFEADVLYLFMEILCERAVRKWTAAVVFTPPQLSCLQNKKRYLKRKSRK